jgi:2-oxoglutarate dehydrogenase E2 component (dihydrolipoamide succinyltransferase)
MHTIEDRPMAVNGQVVIRPMMYLALQLRPPHRSTAKRRSPSSCKVKQAIEDPARLLLAI